MIGFLGSRAGKWMVRALGLAISWLVLTFGLGLDWYGSGHAFLIALFGVMLLCGAYAFDQAVMLVLEIAGMRRPAPPPRVRWQGPIPPLSKAKQAKVRRLHRVMAEAGVFAPEIPDPAYAFAAFAVDRQPVDWMGVLQSLAEAPYYHPELDEAGWEAGWSANLAYDHIPSASLTPPPGRVAALLWEDENIFIALVRAESLAPLGEQTGRGEAWHELGAETIGALAEAGIAVR